MKTQFNNNSLPRGIRNNNPANLILTNIGWNGKIPNSQNTDGKFEQFKTAHYGIRAAFRNIKTQMSKGFDTVETLITRWAPPTENNTNSYISHVKNAVGNSQLVWEPEQMIDLMSAIIKHENGQQPYSQSDLLEAFKAA